jgi:hypothetical protein
VLVSQAWKLVDPYSYNGPAELLVLGGASFEAVIGFVDKVYEPFGTWGMIATITTSRYQRRRTMYPISSPSPTRLSLVCHSRVCLSIPRIAIRLWGQRRFYQAESDASQNWQQKTRSTSHPSPKVHRVRQWIQPHHSFPECSATWV